MSQLLRQHIGYLPALPLVKNKPATLTYNSVVKRTAFLVVFQADKVWMSFVALDLNVQVTLKLLEAVLTQKFLSFKRAHFVCFAHIFLVGMLVLFAFFAASQPLAPTLLWAYKGPCFNPLVVFRVNIHIELFQVPPGLVHLSFGFQNSRRLKPDIWRRIRGELALDFG